MKILTPNQFDALCHRCSEPAMMVSDTLVGTFQQESAVPLSSPLRAFAYAALTSILSVSLYLCVQGAIMIYDLYTIIQWLGGMAE